jgi:Methyltransferase domain
MKRTHVQLARRWCMLAALGLFALAPCIGHAQQNAGPYVPTPSEIVDEMLKLADVRTGDYLFDLGSGDGRIVLTAAERFGTRGFGVDIDAELVKYANQRAAQLGLAERVRFEQRDLFETSLRDATVLTLYLLPHTVTQLVPKILAEMRAGARIVSHDYPLSPWTPDRHLTLNVPEKEYISGTTRTVLYLYTVPARIGGEWRFDLPDTLAGAPARLVIRQEAFRVTGTAIVGGKSVPLEKVTVRGEQVNFVLSRGGGEQALQFTGSAQGDTMQGTVTVSGGAAQWRATRTH